MDIAAEINPTEELSALSYDETVPYEEQLPDPSTETERTSLANRIGSSKVYLLSESSAARVGKRKHGHGEDAVVEDEDENAEMEQDLSYRPNAILFQGPPISHLPTARLFAYATNFDAKPMGLEWVSDNTCVFVFETKAAARNAQRHLQKSAAEDPDEDGFVTAKGIPLTLWPPEQRINATLGKGEGLKGVIRMRWAKGDDVKKKGAKKESDFYKKYGTTAGKEIAGLSEGPQKRRRRDDGDDEILKKSQLDDDLDAFLAGSDEEPDAPASPPSKMYSDHISTNGKTLLERTSLIRAHPTDLASRIMAPLPRRGRERDSALRDARPSSRDAQGENRRSTRNERPKKSQQDLDDELEAFLKERD